MTHIKTAESRVKEFGKYGDSLEMVSFYKQEIKELRAALEQAQNRIRDLGRAYERESNDSLKYIEERDYWYHKADDLADKISECFDVPVGEHSNVNCPIAEAFKILEGEYITKFDKELEHAQKKIAELEAENGIFQVMYDSVRESEKKLKEELKAQPIEPALSMSMFANKADYFDEVIKR